MRSVGIKEAKAHLSELVRAAANGERIVLTHHGEPLAVITSIEEGSASHADGSSGKTPTEQMRELVEASASGGLGVRIQPVDDTMADSLGLERPAARSSPALKIGSGQARGADAGRRDRRVRRQGHQVFRRDLSRLVASMPVGRSVDVVVVREGKEVTKTVTLGRLEDGEK